MAASSVIVVTNSRRPLLSGTETEAAGADGQ